MKGRKIDRVLFFTATITVLVAWFLLHKLHALVPGVHARDRVGMDREREILVHARVLPPDAFRVGVVRCERFDTPQLSETP